MGAGFTAIPDPEHQENGNVAAQDNPNLKGAALAAANAYAKPHSQADDEAPALEPGQKPTPATPPAPRPTASPAPSNAVSGKGFTAVPDPEVDDVQSQIDRRNALSATIQNLGVGKDRADKIALGVFGKMSTAQQNMIKNTGGADTADPLLGLAGLSGLSGGVVASADAAKAAQVARLKEINAMRDARHIQQVAEATSPGTWNTATSTGETVGSRVNAFLRQDAEQTAQAQRGSLTPRPDGGPSWTSSSGGQLPRAPQDLPSLRPQGPSAPAASPKDAATSLLKSPLLWGAFGSGPYHAARTLQFLGKIFGG